MTLSRQPPLTTRLAPFSLCLLALLLGACSSQPSAPTPAPTATKHEAHTSPRANPSTKNPESQRATATRTAPTKNHSQEDYQNILLAIDQWRVQGKLGVRIPGDSGSLYFNWKQDPNHYAIHLSGPLGQGATWIRGNPHQVSIQAGKQPAIFAATPEALMERTLGWSLPLDDLYFWIRGIPSPTSDITALTRNKDEQLETLQQAGWSVSYSKYKSFSGWLLPQKVTAERDNVRLTFINKNWQLF